MNVKVVATLFVVIAACGPKSTPPTGPTTAGPSDAGVDAAATATTPPPPKDPLADAVERVVALYEAIAALPPAGSCQDAAASIDIWAGERATALTQVRDAAQGEQAALVDGLFHDASSRLAAAVKAIDELAVRCAAEPALAAALTRMSTEAGR